MKNLSEIAKNIIKENQFGADPNNHIFAFGQWWTYPDAMRHLDNILFRFSDDYTDKELKDFEAAIQKYAITNEPQVVKENQTEEDDLEKKNLKENITDDKERFEQIIDEIKDLVKEAYNLVPQELAPRAKAYWYGHIVSSIDDDHEFMGKGGHTMRDTLEEFEEEEFEEEEFEEEEFEEEEDS